MQRVVSRNTLSNVNEQLKDHLEIFRTHRSFLVNLNYIRSSSGNAQGYQLDLSHYDKPVPVSRKNIELFDKAIGTRSL